MIRQLGYLVFDVSDLDAWARFAADVLGFGVTADAHGLALRMDERLVRIRVQSGDADDLAAAGWQVDRLEPAIAALERAGVPWTAGPNPAARGVEAYVSFRDPAGVPGELFVGPKTAGGFDSPLVSGFVAGDLGLGHIAITAPNKQASFRFYTDVLGLRHSDDITCTIWGHPVDMAFLHTNGRHHSLAFGGPQPKHLHHFLVEAKTLDDVGAALDRTLKARHGLIHALGRHPNDQMTSFYAKTPSGFAFEFGMGGRIIEDSDAWQPTVYDRISDWGHQPPQLIR